MALGSLVGTLRAARAPRDAPRRSHDRLLRGLSGLRRAAAWPHLRLRRQAGARHTSGARGVAASRARGRRPAARWPRAPHARRGHPGACGAPLCAVRRTRERPGRPHLSGPGTPADARAARAGAGPAGDGVACAPRPRPVASPAPPCCCRRGRLGARAPCSDAPHARSTRQGDRPLGACAGGRLPAGRGSRLSALGAVPRPCAPAAPQPPGGCARSPRGPRSRDSLTAREGHLRSRGASPGTPCLGAAERCSGRSRSSRGPRCRRTLWPGSARTRAGGGGGAPWAGGAGAGAPAPGGGGPGATGRGASGPGATVAAATGAPPLCRPAGPAARRGGGTGASARGAHAGEPRGSAVARGGASRAGVPGVAPRESRGEAPARASRAARDGRRRPPRLAGHPPHACRSALSVARHGPGRQRGAATPARHGLVAEQLADGGPECTGERVAGRARPRSCRGREGARPDAPALCPATARPTAGRGLASGRRSPDRWSAMASAAPLGLTWHLGRAPGPRDRSAARAVAVGRWRFHEARGGSGPWRPHGDGP